MSSFINPAGRDPIAPIHCQAILFDLDGVLVDSRECIDHVRRDWALARHLDPAAILALPHGRRTSEILRQLAPDLDLQTEVDWLERREEVETRGLRPIPGATAFLASLPRDRWAIVTSGGPGVAALRIRVGGVPEPRLLITGADVARGKPAPDPYLQAAALMGIAPADCLVVEDAPAGVASGKAAGMQVLAVGGTVFRTELGAADHYMETFAELRLVAASPAGLELALDGRP